MEQNKSDGGKKAVEEPSSPGSETERFQAVVDVRHNEAVTGESGDARMTLERLAVSGALQVAAGRLVSARRVHLLTVTGPLGYASLFADDLRASIAEVVSLDGSSLSVADAMRAGALAA